MANGQALAYFYSRANEAAPEISMDGWHPYKLSVRDPFRNSAHGVIVKILAVTDLRKDAAHRYSPCAVVAVSRQAVAGVPAEISTAYVERSNLSIRMGSRRFTRLTNGFSRKLECQAAAVSLYVAHYNWCRPHETLTPDARHQTTPALAIGIADHVWSIGELLDALAVIPTEPPETAPDSSSPVPGNPRRKILVKESWGPCLPPPPNRACMPVWRFGHYQTIIGIYSS